MFELCFELGANINIRNKQGYTPLALAAKLARQEVFFFKIKSNIL